MDAAAISSLSGGLAQPYKRGPQCLVGRMIEFVRENEEPGVLEALLQVLDNPRVEAWQLAAFLKENDYDIPSHTIRRHRRRANGNGCRCPE